MHVSCRWTNRFRVSIGFVQHVSNRRLDSVRFRSGLQNMTFGRRFNQSLDNVTLPSGLQNMTFCGRFNQSLDNVTLPTGLQSITFGIPTRVNALWGRQHRRFFPTVNFVHSPLLTLCTPCRPAGCLSGCFGLGVTGEGGWARG